ncbi:unnamed protein product [Ectocarpus sp. 12 AP-2014]
MDKEDSWSSEASGDLPPTPLVEAIESGDRASVSKVLEGLTPDERQRELTTACAGSGAGRSDGTDLSVPSPRTSETVMLPVFHAAYLGHVDVFSEVHSALGANVSHDAVKKMLTSTSDRGGRNLLAKAVQGGAAPVVCALVDLLLAYKLAPAQRVKVLSSANGRNQTTLMVAAQSGQTEIAQAVIRLVGDDWVPNDDEEAEFVTKTDSRGWSALFYAVVSGHTAVVDAVISLIERAVLPEQVNPIIDDCLPLAMSEVWMSNDQVRVSEAVSVLSCLIKHGAGPTPRQVSLVGSKAGFEAARKCFLDAVCSAVNPLLVGMRLSLVLADAAGMGNEGQRQVALRLQNEVEDLVLEVFERLPQTVDGFREGDVAGSGMDACGVVFAPEKMRSRDETIPSHLFQDDAGGTRVDSGPLEMALQARHQLELFCTQPLVLDYLNRAFTRGLPGLDASEAGAQEADQLKLRMQRNASVQVNAGDGESSGEVSRELLEVLEGSHSVLGSLTLSAGKQFILAQVVARPAFSYSVPAVRMAVDLLVYLLMLALFAKDVLWYEEGTVEVGEVVFFVYVLGAILVEINELWDGREEYMKDHWNALDVAALAFCGSAFLVRVYNPESLWGRALYCAGAPLLLFRTLFFAQFMPAQGPMIEIIFSLAGELLRFCTILLVTMMGFAMSFFALFRHSCTVGSFQTYWSTSIALLRAMLGETKLYDDFTVAAECCYDAVEPSDELHCEDFLMECCHNVESEHFNGLVGKALLAAYNVVMGIILLNLLIAVLSEAYVDVKENIDTESKVTRTLVIRHYMKAVDQDMLPPPLNLVQHAVSTLAMLFGSLTGKTGVFRKAEFYAGLVLFWFVSGLFAVLAGSILWAISWPRGVFMFFLRRSSHSGRVSASAALFCGVAMPLFMLYKWLWASTCGALWRHLADGGAWSNDGGASAGYDEIRSDGSRRPRPHDDGIIGKTLEGYGGTAGQGGALNVHQLREFLANPMKDPVVQRDEETRATTVEHVKLLRDNLTEMVGERVGELDAAATARFQSLETSMDGRVDALSKKVDRVDDKLAEILHKLDGAT